MNEQELLQQISEQLDVLNNQLVYLTVTDSVLGMLLLFALGWIAGHQR